MGAGYSSDLTDRAWSIIEKELHTNKGKRGRPPPKDARKMWDAFFYITKNGCFWRDLPKDFGDWKRVYNYFSRLKHRGVIEAIMHKVREMCRIDKGKDPCPSVGIIDSQSVKTRSFKKSGQGV
jgi:putative transposase